MTNSRPIPLLVTGAGRSGTSLVDKLLTAHPHMVVLSQPLQLLYVELKRKFLAGLGPDVPAYPINDLFAGTYTSPNAFTEFLEQERLDPDWTLGVLRAMKDYEGQYFKTVASEDALVPHEPVSLAEFVRHYVGAATDTAGSCVVGTKETLAEEFIPYFLTHGYRVLMVIRDPRDVVASVFSGKGPELAGTGRPLLYVLRQWRKSVAFALEHEPTDALRIIRYEDLVAQPLAELNRIAEWLNCAEFESTILESELRTPDGAVWASNSSYTSRTRLSDGSVGVHGHQISDEVARAIAAICGPEMLALEYLTDIQTSDLEFESLQKTVVELCPSPRESLRHYVWSPEQLKLESLRIEGLVQKTFSPELHLLPHAFEVLARAFPSTSEFKRVYESRASAILYRLAQCASPGRFLLPANICPEVPLAIMTAGRSVQFIDIDETTLCMDPRAAIASIKEHGDAAGVVYARTYGAMFDASEFFNDLRALGPSLLIVDDRCACRPDVESDSIEHPAISAVIYSTGYGKYLDLGGGGFGVLRAEVPYGSEARPFDSRHAAAVHEVFSQFARTDASGLAGDLLAANPHWLDTTEPERSWAHYCNLIRDALPEMDAHKRSLNETYRTSIPERFQLGPEFNAWRFAIRVPDKPAVLARIFEAGAFASGHYRSAVHAFGGPAAPVTDRLHAEVINLFNDRYADSRHSEIVVETLRRFLG